MRPRLTIVCATVALCQLSSMEAQAVTQCGASPNPSPDTVFRSGTRLVEVEVVVRDQNGPITALTPRILCKRLEIAVFQSGSSNVGLEAVSSAASGHRPPADSFSNRASHAGHSINGATVLLLDQLNTAFDNPGYARSQMLKFLESHQAEEPVAIYLLAKKLTVVQDFMDEHDSLSRAVRKWKPENLGLLIESDELMDATDRKASSMSDPIYQMIRNQITREALAKGAQHLSGMPGRKSLVWVSDTPGIQGVQFLRAADIHLYPVLTHGVGSSEAVAWMRDTREMGFPATYSMPPLATGNEL